MGIQVFTEENRYSFLFFFFFPVFDSFLFDFVSFLGLVGFVFVGFFVLGLFFFFVLFFFFKPFSTKR